MVNIIAHNENSDMFVLQMAFKGMSTQLEKSGGNFESIIPKDYDKTAFIQFLTRLKDLPFIHANMNKQEKAFLNDLNFYLVNVSKK